MPIILDWVKDQQYVIQDDSGHGIVVESRPDGVPAGFTPSQLLLAAAAGCMANHVISILKKKRLTIAGMRVMADGQRSSEHPKRYTTIDLGFEARGDIPKEALNDAVLLAKDKYCSVLNSLDPTIVVNVKSKVITL